MKKLLVVISTESKEMIKFALNFTLNMKQSGDYEDVRLFFFGPSEKVISQDDDLQKLFVKVVNDGKFVPVACINVANNYGIKQELEKVGFRLTPIGVDITKSINADYVTLTF